jgi:UDP-glucose 4-epimerase
MPVQRLVADGNEVIVVDNLSTDSLKNATALIGKPGFEFVKGDIRDESVIESALKNEPIHIYGTGKQN